MHGEGIWDSYDINYKDIRISVKSTKSFGNLMLFEAKDWNENGLYVPNLGTGNEFYDYFVLVRLKPYAADLLRKNRLYYSSYANKNRLKQIIFEKVFTFDIPGFISRKTLIYLIKNNYLIKQNGYINRITKKNRLDAENYYIQAGNLHDIKILIDHLKRI